MSSVIAPAQPEHLRIRADRIGLYAAVFIAFGAAMVVLQWIATQRSADWGVFQTAAHHAGTPQLLAYGQMNPFVYLPAFAWAYVPFAGFPEVAGAMINAVVMLALAAAAAYLAARTYRIPIAFSMLLTFAWCPVWSVIVLGQNAAIGLVFSLLAILGATENMPWLEGIAIAVLLYKPQYALPFLLLALVLRHWHALAITLAGAVLWYFACVIATAGDWGWPSRWLHVVRDYAPLDAAHNAPFALGIPTLLSRFGMPETFAFTLGLLILLFGAFKLAKRPLAEAWSLVPLIGLATSAHALEYDAVLALPAIFWAVTRIAEPLRTRLVAIAYIPALFWLFSSMLRFDPLMIPVTFGAIAYLLAPRIPTGESA